MATISIQQAAQYACNAGFPVTSIPLWVAIMEGESSLDTTAVNSSDPYGGSFGIAQINGAHFNETFGNGAYIMNQQTAFDPQLAMIFSYGLSNAGTNFTAWGAYTNGSYLQYLATVKQTLQGWNCTPGANGSGKQGQTAGCVPCGAAGLACCPPNVCWNPITDSPTTGALGVCSPPAATNVLNLGIPDWIRNPQWGRILEVVGGVIVLGIALLGLFWPQAEQVIGTVAKTAEVAAV